MALFSFARSFKVNKAASVVGAVALLSLAGSANAALFSFASDDESDFPTFSGSAASGTSFTMTHARTPRDRVTLRIDDNNGSRPTVSLAVGFTSNLTLTYVNSVGTANNQVHAYSVTGSFAFVDVNTGAPLLTIDVTSQNPAGMAIGGTMTNWGSAGSVFGSDSTAGGGVTYTTTPALFTFAQSQGIDLTQYGIMNTPLQASVGPLDDFAFTLTFVSAVNPAGLVPINPTTRLPTGAWRAEGSYSGSATWGVPAPGSVAMLGAAGLLMAGRRRR